jgi:hypothetical protein
MRKKQASVGVQKSVSSVIAVAIERNVIFTKRYEMDKQKQMIEEIQQFLLSSSCNWWETYPNGKDKSEYVAECFYNAGYRKIPENAVVLTEERNKIICDRIEQLERVETELQELNAKYYNEAKDLRREVKRVRKETAEKFARLVEFHSVSTRDEEGREIFTISALGLKEILHEEFGIPYDEIAK